MTENRKDDARWKATFSDPGAAPQAPLFRHLPSDPRCSLCSAPFRAPFGPVLGALGFGQMKRYPQLCNMCFNLMSRKRGGAEVEITVLFADVRGSTGIAEQQSAAEFSQLLSGFYALATEAVQAETGVIDKFLGDGVMALFFPSFTQRMDAARAVEAARRILAGTELPVGAGVNTGPAFTGFLGPSDQVAAFSALGDAVNVAHRLGEAAGPGELIVSAETVTKAGFDPATSGERWQQRELSVKGRDQAVEAWALHIPAREATRAAEPGKGASAQTL